MTSVEHHITEAIRAAQRAITALDRFQPTHKAPEAEVGADPGCQSCRRIKNSRGAPLHSETEKRDDGLRPLCRWCRRWADAYRQEWVELHLNQPVPTDPQRFWPPRCAVEWRRDNEGKNATPSLWIEWRAAKTAEKKKGRKKAS